jgi:hypothetical protein
MGINAWNSGGSRVWNDNYFGKFYPVLGTEYDIEFNWDLTNGETRLFIDGVQLGNTVTTTFTRNNVTSLALGLSSNTSDLTIRDFGTYNTVQHTSNFTIKSLPIMSIIDENINTNGYIKSNLTDDSTSATTGSLIISGGAGFAKNLHVNGNILNTVAWTTENVTLCPSGGPIQNVIVPTYLYKNGRNVTWRIPKFQVIGNNATGYISSTIGFTTTYRPNEDIQFTYHCNDISGSGTNVAEVQVKSDGTVVFTAIKELSFSAFTTTMYLFNYALSLNWSV